ncbi:MAG: diguanylate cyclase [Dehalococcoidia bacterium]
MENRSTRILVVEDDNDVASLLDQLLGDEGYQVQRVATGAEAIERLGTGNPDLVLLDVMLPDTDGFEVCRLLWEREGALHVPVIMLTALADARDRVRGIRCGADDYLTKPFDVEELLSRIELRLAQARREQEQREAAVRTSLQAISHVLAAPETVADLVLRIVDQTPMMLGGAACGVLLWNESQRRFQPVGAIGLEPERQQQFNLLDVPLWASTAIDDLVLHRRPFTLRGDAENPIGKTVLDAFQKDTILGAPMVHQGSLYGMLLLGRNSREQGFSENNIELICKIADQAALALSNQRSIEQLEQLAVTDYLTGLYNPRYFHQFLDQQLARAIRSGEPTSLLLLDLDHFKRIDDTHGHTTGDSVLAEVARVLRSSIRDSDVAVRYGGEEFAAILPNTDRLQALSVAERIIESVRALRISAERTTVRVTTSIGLATTFDGDETQEALIRSSDRSLYRAKQAGRDCIR